jgi:hypothetical protein
MADIHDRTVTRPQKAASIGGGRLAKHRLRRQEKPP